MDEKPSDEPHAPRAEIEALLLNSGKLTQAPLEELTTIFQNLSEQAPLRFGLSGTEAVLPICSLRSR